MNLPANAPEAMLPKGVKDFLPLKAAKIEHLRRVLHEIFAQWGFRPLIPPSLEFLHVLERGLGEGLRERAFRFDDRQSGRLLAFPPDITPQVARIVATRMREVPLPLRISYEGRVLRHTEQQAGKDREIFQAGVEMIGLQSPEADAEMIAMVVECLKALGVDEFTVDIGQVEFFRGVMAELPLSGGLARDVQTAIGHKDNAGLRALLADAPIADRAKEEILALPRLFGGPEVLEKAEHKVVNPRSRAALNNMAQVLQVLEVYGVQKHVTLGLGELRGLDYHTGVTFQGFLPGIGRAVCSGGRYDNLTGRYGYPAPATGFTFNILNLLFALERQLEQQTSRSTDVLIFQRGADKVPAQKVARALREQGFSAARDMIARALEETLDYAQKMNFRFVMIIGDGDTEVRVVRVADRVETRTSLPAVLAGEFTL